MAGADAMRPNNQRTLSAGGSAGEVAMGCFPTSPIVQHFFGTTNQYSTCQLLPSSVLHLKRKKIILVKERGTHAIMGCS